AEIYSRGPAGRLLKRLALLLKPEDIAAVPVKTDVVYSNNPTHAQRQLPAEAADALQAHLAEHNSWVNAARQLKPEKFDESHRIRNIGARSLDQFAVMQGPGTVLVHIRNDQYNSAISILVADTNGHRIDGSSATIRSETQVMATPKAL